MCRDLNYLFEQKDTRVVQASANGWTLERLRVIAILNSFNRVVVGPLSAAYRTETKSGLGRETPIQYGERLEISSKTAGRVRPALDAFERLATESGLKRHWLNISRTSDLVWAIGSRDDDGEGNDGGQESNE